MARMTLPPFVNALPHGIYIVDTGFQRDDFDAAYLIVERGRAAFVDTGTAKKTQRLMHALTALGLAPGDVDWVILTHVHLDHAGGAGAVMLHLPNAKLLVHPRGERHMVNPLALIMGAREVYGPEEMARSYGKVEPIAQERVVTSTDGMTIDFAGRPLQLLHTPGHAKHHHCVWDERSRGFFTGDTFGLSYRDFDTERGAYLLPTTTPVQFDPVALRESVDRMAAYQPECLYLTHYGRVTDVPALQKMMLAQLDDMVALALALKSAEDRHAKLKAGLSSIYLRHLRAHGGTISDERAMALLGLDIELNAQGLEVWLDKDKTL